MAKANDGNVAVRFRALQIANEHRNAYGLRYNDYNRYRNHCANRAHRLRSSLKMTHGKGREFKKLPQLTTDNTKNGHLELLLFEAERAWSYSQELHADSSKPANANKAGNLRHSATGRFRRALHWCTKLLSHCQSLYDAGLLSAENMVEATAYTLILSGKFLRFRDEYEDALDQLCVSRSLLDELADGAVNSRDQALATLFADQISPEIRYSAHQLGHTKSYEIDSIVKEVSPRRRKELVHDYDGLMKKLKSEVQGKRGVDGRQTLRALIWDGKEVPVRNPELVDVLLQVQKAEDVLNSGDTASTRDIGEGSRSKRNKSRKGVAAFDAVLAALSDAEDVARKLAVAQQAGNTSTSGVGTRDIQYLHAYIVYQLLSRRIQRDLTLVSALANPSPSHKMETGSTPQKDQPDARVNPAVVKLLDTVLQSLAQMRSLSIVDENPDLSNVIEIRLVFTKSRRSLFLSRSHAVVKQYAQALALTQRAKTFIRETSSLLAATIDPTLDSESSFYPISVKLVSALEDSLIKDETRVKQDWFSFNGGTASLERDPTKKPLFFDIALNYVQLDMDRLQERAGIQRKLSGPSRPAQEQKPAMPVAKAKAEEIVRPTTPEPGAAGRYGLTDLLGGWWGRK